MSKEYKLIIFTLTLLVIGEAVLIGMLFSDVAELQDSLIRTVKVIGALH